MLPLQTSLRNTFKPVYKKTLLLTINELVTMIRTTFNQLREVKDSLPKGSSAVIAEELGIAADDVRAFFNGTATVGYHIEPGPDGGIVVLDDTKVLEVALRIAWASKNAL